MQLDENTVISNTSASNIYQFLCPLYLQNFVRTYSRRHMLNNKNKKKYFLRINKQCFIKVTVNIDSDGVTTLAYIH